MNYGQHYNTLILRAETRVLEGYSEKHHVVPKCLDKDSDEVVRLTPEEHFVAHQLLVKMCPGVPGLVFAAVSMTAASKSTYARRGNKLYGWLRRAHSIAISQTLKGRKWSEEEREAHGEQWNKGLKTGPASEEQKAILRIVHRQRYKDNPELASRHSLAMKTYYEKQENRDKTRAAAKKVHELFPQEPLSPEARARQAASLRAYYEDPVNRKRLSDQAKGKPAWNKDQSWSEEVLVKLRGPKSLEVCATAKAAAIAREEKRKADPVAYAQFRARKLQQCRKTAAEKKAADALFTPEQRLQQTVERLERRVAKLEAKAAMRFAKGETA